MYFKENWKSMAEKKPPFGHADIFQTSPSLLESLDFLAVDTFCFEDREEILGHGVIIAISSS